MKTLRSDLVQTARDRARAAIRFRLHYCPSGGSMLQEGKAEHSDRHPAAFGVTEEPRTWSFGQ